VQASDSELSPRAQREPRPRQATIARAIVACKYKALLLILCQEHDAWIIFTSFHSTQLPLTSGAVKDGLQDRNPCVECVHVSIASFMYLQERCVSVKISEAVRPRLRSSLDVDVFTCQEYRIHQLAKFFISDVPQYGTVCRLPCATIASI